MPEASNALLPNLKKGLFSAVGEGSIIFVACFLHNSDQMCLYLTPGRCPPPITGRFVNSVTRGSVGAPNGRAPFKFYGAVVGFVDRCLSRTRNLAASNKHLAEFFSGRSWPKIGPGIIYFGVFEKFEGFFSKICAHSERYRNLLVGIFEVLTFMETSRFHCHRSYTMSTTEWRLAIFSCGMPACVTPRGLPHSPKGNLECTCMKNDFF